VRTAVCGGRVTVMIVMMSMVTVLRVVVLM
jgi:hypothetical protein